MAEEYIAAESKKIPTNAVVVYPNALGFKINFEPAIKSELSSFRKR